jgi:hypothetical protein
MRKGKKYVARLCLCCTPTHQGEGVDRNGRLWRWEFSPQFGPLFVNQQGDPLLVQPMSERHPVWPVFNEWLAAHQAKKRDGVS